MHYDARKNEGKDEWTEEDHKLFDEAMKRAGTQKGVFFSIIFWAEFFCNWIFLIALLSYHWYIEYSENDCSLLSWTHVVRQKRCASQQTMSLDSHFYLYCSWDDSKLLTIGRLYDCCHIDGYEKLNSHV